MSWSRRRLLTLACLAVGGCGFEPVYAQRGADGEADGGLAEQLRAIALPEARSAVGYAFRQALGDQLNPTGTQTLPLYRLDYLLELVSEDLAVQLDAVVTRRNLSLATTFSLADIDGTLLMRGRARRIASYNVRQERYNDLVARQDAERRAAEELAIAVRQQLVAHFQRQAAA